MVKSTYRVLRIPEPELAGRPEKFCISSRKATAEATYPLTRETGGTATTDTKLLGE